jgi:hypothetical protein
MISRTTQIGLAVLSCVLGACEGIESDADSEGDGADVIEGFDDGNGMPDLTISRRDLEASIKSPDPRVRAGFLIRDFRQEDCAVVEGMIDPKDFRKQFMKGGPNPGRRFLMRFNSMTPNVGNTMIDLGDPTAGVAGTAFEPLEGAVDQDGKPLFKFSNCHHHMHFIGYAHYELLDPATKEPMFVKDEHDERGVVEDDADLDPETDFEMDDEFKTFLRDAKGNKIRKRLGVGLKRAFCLSDMGPMSTKSLTLVDNEVLRIFTQSDPAKLESGGVDPKSRKKLTATELAEVRRIADDQMKILRAFAQSGQPAVDRIVDEMIAELGTNPDKDDVARINKLRKGPHVRHTCDFQGIRAGFMDLYAAHLAGQWIDVTDLKPGKYIMRVTINPNKMTEVRIPKMKDGKPLPILDENGEPKLLLDDDGEPILGKDGEPLIKVQRRRVKFETNFDNNIAEIEVVVPEKVVSDSFDIVDDAFRPDVFIDTPDDN